jgi:hypothetical protein
MEAGLLIWCWEVLGLEITLFYELAKEGSAVGGRPAVGGSGLGQNGAGAHHRFRADMGRSLRLGSEHLNPSNCRATFFRRKMIQYIGINNKFDADLVKLFN